MRLLIFFFLASIIFCTAAILGSSCWDEDDVEYYISNKSYFLPIAKVSPKVAFELSQALRAKANHGVAIRKPTADNKVVHCRHFDLQEKASRKAFRRLISHFKDVPEIAQIFLYWPTGELCFTDTTSKDGLLPLPMLGVKPSCSHALIFSTEPLNRRVSVSRFTPDQLFNHAFILDVLLDVVSGYDSSTDIKVEVVDWRSPRKETPECRISQYRWRSQALRFSTMLDMYISSGMIDRTYYFVAYRRKGCTNVAVRSNPEKSNLTLEHLRKFLESLLVSANPLMVPRMHPRPNSLKTFIEQVIKGSYGAYQNAGHQPKSAGHVYDVVFLKMPVTFYLQNFIYLAFYLIDGPFQNKWYRLVINSHRHVTPPKDNKKDVSILISAIDKNAQTEIYKSFVRIILETGFDGVAIAKAKWNLKAPVNFEFYPFSKDSTEPIKRAFPKGGFWIFTLGEIMEVRSNTVKPIYTELADSYISPALGAFDESAISPSDRKVLGLPQPSFATKDNAKLRAKRKLRKLQARIEKDFASLLLSPDETSSSSEQEEDIDDSSNDVEEAYKRHLTAILDSKIIIDKIRRKLSEIQAQCADCHELSIKHQKLMIFELFLKVKNLLSRWIPENSSVLVELKNPNSFLCSKLGEMSLKEEIPALISALTMLTQERQMIAKPSYQGQGIFWISKQMKGLFKKLLPSYQSHHTEIPERNSLSDYELESPEHVDIAKLEQVKQERQEIDAEAANIMAQYAMAKQEGIHCLELYRDTEYLIVGALFNNVISDLQSRALTGDWFEEAGKASTAVSQRMLEVGISSVSTVMQMRSFVARYRNDVAHPDFNRSKVEQFDEELNNYVYLYRKLKIIYYKLMDIFDEAERAIPLNE